ncbi:MAG: cytochrome c family protein [ANME-2 cluster archaeon]|nr:cytochrome c family protein [ANME-2 cluster archaeon]
MKIRWVLIYAVLLMIVISYGASSYPSYNTEEDCRSCHGITVDRHHLLIPNGTYQCTDCHAMKYDTQNQIYYPEVIRNCLTCHVGKEHTDAHHLLVQQGLFVCTDCHAMKYDTQNQTYYPEIIWDCTICHSTVLIPGTPVPTPTPTPVNPPTISNLSPTSPAKDIIGASREFTITVDQIVDFTWYLDNNPVQSNESVLYAGYTNTGAALGVWNISVKASNVDGNIMYIWTWNVSSIPPPPVITISFPTSSINDIVGTSRKFGITIDQIANIVWYINGNPVQSNVSVMGASYNNSSTTIGIWNVSAIATNANGRASHTWTWNVAPLPVPPVISNFAPNPLVNDIVGASRTFNITIDQPADVSWYINGILVQSNGSISEARYTNNSSAVGTWNVSAIATNANGSVMCTWTWKVMYYFSGFLSPIKTDGRSIFKLGSIVPIKFQLRDANGNDIKSADVRLNFTKIISTATGTYLEPFLIENETTGDVFIFSNTSNMYKYNLATKNMSSATWQIRVDIDDGNSNTVNISLKC